MKLLADLSATLSEGEYVEPRDNVTVLHDEPVPGFFRRITLGAAGLVVSVGNEKLAVPLAEILKLAEQHHEGLRPPTPVEPAAQIPSGPPSPELSTLNSEPSTPES